MTYILQERQLITELYTVELYTSPSMAASLRGISKILKKAFNINVSYEGIRKWIMNAKKEIPRRKHAISSVWHADETYIKIKGKGYWLWIVYEADSRQVLAWTISKKRSYFHARDLFQKAMKVAGIRPRKIITDGLYQYQAAIKNVMGWHWKEQKKRHIIDSEIGRAHV